MVSDNPRGSLPRENSKPSSNEQPLSKDPPQRDPVSLFFSAVIACDLAVLQSQFANMGTNINIQQPGTKAAALHYAAAFRSRPVIKWLIRSKELDFLVRDREGRLPSVLAYEVANDPVIGRFLAKKENEQARARGIDISALLTS